MKDTSTLNRLRRRTADGWCWAQLVDLAPTDPDVGRRAARDFSALLLDFSGDFVTAPSLQQAVARAIADAHDAVYEAAAAGQLGVAAVRKALGLLRTAALAWATPGALHVCYDTLVSVHCLLEQNA